MNLECMMYDDRLRPYDRIPSIPYPPLLLINLFSSTPLARILHSIGFSAPWFFSLFSSRPLSLFQEQSIIRSYIQGSHTDLRHAIFPVPSLIKKGLPSVFIYSRSAPPPTPSFSLSFDKAWTSIISFNYDYIILSTWL